MKNHFKRQFCFCFIFFIIAFQCNLYSQNNFISNADFEFDTSSWIITTGVFREKQVTKSSKYVLSLVDNAGGSQKIFGLRPNTTYLLKGWLKSSNHAVVTMGVKWYGGNELAVQTNAANYKQLSVKFTTGAASTTAIIFLTNPPGGNNTMYVDHLMLTETNDKPYELVWSDEFNGSGAVNSNYWSFENGFVRNEEQQWYQAENAFQLDGNLVFQAKKENIPNSRQNPNYIVGSLDWKKSRPFINYTAASIKTVGKKSWLYGRFEVRAKITNLNGTWPAIWTLGNNCEWPSNGEIDIMENYGGNVLANFAWGTKKRWNAKWDTFKKSASTILAKDATWFDKFHIWTLDWDRDKMSIYLDDELLNEIDLNTTFNGTYNCGGQNPFRQPHYLLLNLALIADADVVSNLVFPNEYLVDYVRVYQKK